MRSIGLLAVVSLIACSAGPVPPSSSSDGGCTSGDFLYNDRSCGTCAPDAGCSSAACAQHGDGLCYRRCSSDIECGIGTRCAVLGLFAGGDYGCNQRVRVCSTKEKDDCAAQ